MVIHNGHIRIRTLFHRDALVLTFDADFVPTLVDERGLVPTPLCDRVHACGREAARGLPMTRDIGLAGILYVADKYIFAWGRILVLTDFIPPPTILVRYPPDTAAIISCFGSRSDAPIPDHADYDLYQLGTDGLYRHSESRRAE